MCGIAGFFSTSAAPDPQALLARQVLSLVHRGPDDRGHYIAAPGGMSLHREKLVPGHDPRPIPPPPWPLLPPPPGLTVGMGVSRLAIVGVSDGQAPISTASGATIVVLNGEIYNHHALRERLRAEGRRFYGGSDTEVIAHLYESVGIEGTLAQLRGMFGLAVWDARRGLLFLARDPMGIKPLHVAVQSQPGGQRLWFGSEPRAILADASFQRSLSPAALARYLMMEASPAPHCMFQSMFKLEAGSYVQVGALPSGDIDVRHRSFWSVPQPGSDRPPGLPAPSDTQGWVKRVREAVVEAVRLRVPDEVPVAALLSGGIDSGLVTALLAREVTGGLHTFSLGFDDPDFDLTGLARRIAAHLGLKHEVIHLGVDDLEPLLDRIGAHQDEPLGDHSLVPTWALSEAVRAAGYPVALSGDGGDELFAGYPTYVAGRFGRLLTATPAALARAGLAALDRLPASGGNFGPDVKARLLLTGALEPQRQRRQLGWMGAMNAADMQALLLPGTLQALRAGPHPDAYEEVDRWAWLQRRRDSLGQAQVQDLRFYLQDVVLQKVDRASMANALEVRVPLLDTELCKLALALPNSLKIKGLTPKWMLRALFAEVLPADIAAAPKKGFGMPTARWLRAMGKDKLMGWLSPPTGADALLDPRQVEAYVDAHLSGRRDHRRVLWTIISLRRWQGSAFAAPLAT